MVHEILIVDDEPDIRLLIDGILRDEGYETRQAADSDSAIAAFRARRPALVILDVWLQGSRLDGLGILQTFHSEEPQVPVVMISGHGTIEMAVAAIQQGAYDFIEKPFASERLIETVRRALERRLLMLENLALRRELAGQNTLAPRIIGKSPAIEQVRKLLANVAPTDASVLINGDTGAGKELIARSLHDLSPRHDKPFVAVNCGALPEPMFESEMFGYEAGAFTGAAKRRIGKLEHASGGTLFLDEIESMPLSLQVKLLRVLQDGVLERLGSNQPVRADLRVVAAAKGDMSEHVAARTFRRDLLYRLNVVTIALPPLAERREDIVPLFEHFLLDAAVRYQRSAPLLTERDRMRLTQRDWPGNVRELRNAADRRVLGIPDDLSAGAAGGDDDALPLKERVEQYERALIADALQQSNGAVAQAAERLQMPKATLYEKIRRYGLAVRGEG